MSLLELSVFLRKHDLKLHNIMKSRLENLDKLYKFIVLTEMYKLYLYFVGIIQQKQQQASLFCLCHNTQTHVLSLN